MLLRRRLDDDDDIAVRCVIFLSLGEKRFDSRHQKRRRGIGVADDERSRTRIANSEKKRERFTTIIIIAYLET